MPMNVLLSHINDETQVASILKQWIESSLDRDVHLSGEAASVQLDEQRLAAVNQTLGEARVVLLLCSERSIGRPWINFESACAWFKRVPVIAVCHAGCSPADLPPPLGSFPACDLTDAGSCQALLETLAEQLQKNRVPRIDYGLMVDELVERGRGAERCRGADQGSRAGRRAVERCLGAGRRTTAPRCEVSQAGCTREAPADRHQAHVHDEGSPRFLVHRHRPGRGPGRSGEHDPPVPEPAREQTAGHREGLDPSERPGYEVRLHG